MQLDQNANGGQELDGGNDGSGDLGGDVTSINELPKLVEKFQKQQGWLRSGHCH
jgi:hypothetical protein